MEKELRFGIIGCSMISGFHMGAMEQLPGICLAGVCDATAERARAVAREKGCTAYESPDSMWEDDTLDGVCICTPSGTHGALALEALRHGKHVLVEKPMALTRQECLSIASLARERGLQAGVVSQLRFSPAIQAVRQAMAEGRLGKLISLELNMKYYRDPAYYQASAWRGTREMDGGGALMNQGIHGVDLMQYLAGMPRQVYAQARTLRHSIQVEDTLHGVLMYENGALGSLVATTSVWPGFSRELTLCGENGTISLKEDAIATWCLRDGSAPPELGKTGMNGSSDPSQIDLSGHIRQIRNFAMAIAGKEPLLVDAAEGKKPLDIIWSLYRSAQENRPVCVEGEETI